MFAAVMVVAAMFDPVIVPAATFAPVMVFAAISSAVIVPAAMERAKIDPVRITPPEMLVTPPGAQSDSSVWFAFASPIASWVSTP